MKHYFTLFLIFSYACIAFADSSDLTLACSHQQLCQLAKQVALEAGIKNIQVQSLVKMSGDPHAFEPSAAELKSLINAPILITGSHELNPWMKKVSYQRSKNKSLITLVLQPDKSDFAHYPQGSSEALSHFWLYPKIYCRMKSELALKMTQKQLIKKTALKNQCQSDASEIEDAIKITLEKNTLPIVLTHDALLPLLLSLKISKNVIVAIKGSGHHEEASAQMVKKLYDALAAPRVIWIEELDIHIPANIMAKKRKQDMTIKIDTAHSSDNVPFAVLNSLNSELKKVMGP